MMKKRSLIFFAAFPLVVAAALAFCWTSLKQSFVEWTLQEYCRKSLGVYISYEKAVSLKDNVIYLKGVTASPIDPETSSFGVVNCPEAYVRVGFDFGSKTLSTNVLLKNFELNLNQPSLAFGALANKGRSRRSHFFDLKLSVQGEGDMVWLEERSPLKIDFNFGHELEGALQWDEASGRFRVGEENCKFVFVAHHLSAPRLFGLIAHVAPGSLPVQVEEGWLSGSFSLTEDQLVAAVDGEDLTISSDAWKLFLPACHADAHENSGRLIFDSGSVSCPLGSLERLKGQLSCDGEHYHLQASGESSGAVVMTDVQFEGGEVGEGSHIEVASDSFRGEIIFQESMGFAHFMGDDLELGAIWDPIQRGCQGEVTLFGKDKLDFTLTFSDDLTLQSGSISGQEVDLSQLPSFSLWNQTVDSEGLVSFVGLFDSSSVTMVLSSDELSLRGRTWDFVTRQPIEGKVTYHWNSGGFQFESEIKESVVNLDDVSFSHFSAHCIGDSSGMRFQQCWADCQGIELGGDVLISFYPELEIEFYQHTLLGTIPCMQSFLKKSGASHPLLKFPMDGTLSCGDQGGYFKWSQDSGVLEGTIGAELTDGVMTDPFLETKWDHLQASFIYDLRGDHLVVSEGKGLCETPRGGAIPLVIDRFEVTDFSTPLIGFDLWCGDKKRDLVRACGETISEEDFLSVVFDPQVTHFGSLYPDEFDLRFGRDGAIDRFHLVTGFEVETLEEELKQFFLSQTLCHAFIQDLKGNLFLKLDYSEGEFYTFLHGKNLLTSQQKFQDFQFLGSYKNGLWHIEKLELDDFSLAADLVRHADGFDVKFLGCQWGETSLLGMDGVISPKWDRIEANLNLVDIDLSDLETVEFLQPLFSQFHPQGSMRAHNGKLLMVLSDGDWDVDLSFTATLKNLSLDQLKFQDLAKIQVSYQTDKRLLIQGGEPSRKDTDGIHLELGKIDLDFNRHELWIKETVFRIPSSYLNELNLFLVKKFPGAVNSSLSAVLREIKTVEPLVGTLNFSLNPVQSETEVCFQDGQYQIFDAPWDLKEFTFLKLDREITLSAQCQLWGEWVRLKTQYVGKSFPSGVLAIERGDEQLDVWWRKGGSPHITLDRVEGVLAGAQINMSRQGSRLVGTALSQDLTSQIEIDAQRVTFSDVSWKGKSGSLTCPIATISLGSKGKWEFDIPRIIGEALSTRQLTSWDEFIDENLVIRNMELLNLRGPLMEPNKVSGSGYLTFYNPHQSEIRHFPFVKEKIQDLSVLKPVSGEVKFLMGDGLLTLTSLTDVVDQRQMFRYCLPSGRQSLLSADGSVHLLFHLMPNHSKVRMGGHVSIVVEGTLDDPSFSLVKTKEVMAE